MESLGHLLSGFAAALSWQYLLYAFAGCMLGTLIGVLPGLGPAAGTAILIPLTFSLDATGAIIMLAAIYYGAMYGGTITSVLINTPGESASVVTCIDGYQMALQGRAGPALGFAAIGSFIAGTIGVVLLMLISPLVARARPARDLRADAARPDDGDAARRRDRGQGLQQHGVRPDAGDGRLRHR